MDTTKYITAPPRYVDRSMHELRNGHRGGVFWFTGLSGAGKSTIVHAVEKNFFEQGVRAVVLDGDCVRHGLCADLSFSDSGRMENIRRIAELSMFMIRQGIVCLCAFITPLEVHRALARSIIKEDYREIFVSCSLQECENRDVKGYYKLARENKIKNYTGISAPYDIPVHADITIHTDTLPKEACVAQAQNYIQSQITLPL